MSRPDRNNTCNSVLGRYKHAEWKIEESGFDSLHRLENLPFPRRVQTQSGAQPSSYSMGARNLCIFIVRVYLFLLLSMYSYCSSMYYYRCLFILIVVYVFLDAAILTEVFPCFFLGCKANSRV